MTQLKLIRRPVVFKRRDLLALCSVLLLHGGAELLNPLFTSVCLHEGELHAFAKNVFHFLVSDAITA